jgi:hypothetical protein
MHRDDTSVLGPTHPPCVRCEDEARLHCGAHKWGLLLPQLKPTWRRRGLSLQWRTRPRPAAPTCAPATQVHNHLNHKP